MNTTNAKLADKGSTLKPMPSGTVWVAGDDVEVAWVQKAWHGGGYSYRLCPARWLALLGLRVVGCGAGGRV